MASRFIDRVKVDLKGGDGGRGCVSFRREVHTAEGRRATGATEAASF